MTNKEIRETARQKVENNFDSLLFFSLMSDVVKTIAAIIPVVGSVLVSPLQYSFYDVFERSELYQRVTTHDFLKYFRCLWHKAFGYKSRSLFYIFRNFLMGLVIFFAALLGLSLLAPIIMGISASGNNIESMKNVANTGTALAGIYMVVIIGGLLVLEVLLLLTIPRYLSTIIGSYIIYKNPKMNSKTALNYSIDMMTGNRWNYFKMSIGLIPEAIKCLFFGYGLPVIYESDLLLFEQIYNNYKERVTSNGLEEEPLEDVCPVCGTLKRDDSNFCSRCGSEF